MAKAPYENAIIAVSAALIVGGGIFAAIKISEGAERRRARREGRDLDNTVDKDIEKSGKPATSSKTNYKLLSDRLYKALNQWNPDEVQVYQVLAQMNNDRDVLELIKAFGMKLNNSNGWDADIDTNLAGFMTKLDEDQINAVNIGLARQGIKFRF
jgi:hypothetical protein